MDNSGRDAAAVASLSHLNPALACMRVCTGQSVVVGVAGGDRAAQQLLQVRRLHRGHVPGRLHPSSPRQGRPVLPAKQLSPISQRDWKKICRVQRHKLGVLTARFDIGALCDPIVRRMYVDKKRFKINAIASEISYLSGRTTAIIIDAILNF